MSEITQGVIRFLGYRVTELTYKCSPSFELKDVQDGTFRFNFRKTVIKQNERTIQLNLLTNLFYSADEHMESSPYILTLEVASRFDSESDWDEHWEANALAIVFPYVRAIIATFTAQSGREAITLPTVNMASMFGLVPTEETKEKEVKE